MIVNKNDKNKKGYIDFYSIQGGKIGMQIQFRNYNPDWHEPILVKEEVAQVIADPENDIEGVEYSPAEWDKCDFPQYTTPPFIPLESFVCDHNSPNILHQCFENAVKQLGDEWEVE